VSVLACRAPGGGTPGYEVSFDGDAKKTVKVCNT
jgi:hypothetical protein